MNLQSLKAHYGRDHMRERSSSKRFSVAFPKSLSRAAFAFCAFILLIPLAFTLFQGERNPAMYVCFLLFDLPFLFCGIWARNYRIDVDGDRICVRRWNGTRYSFEASEIEAVVHRVNHTAMGMSEAIRIKAKRHKASAETLMEGFEQMKAFIQERVPEDRVRVIEKVFVKQS